MSRRAKRRSGSSKKSSSRLWGRWVFRLVIVMMIAAAVLSVAGYMWLRGYLSSKEFRQTIVTAAEKSLRAETTISPLRWDGFQVNADTFEATGDAGLRQLTIDGVKTGIDAGGVMRGVWSVSPSRITKLSVVWDTTAEPLPQEEPEPALIPHKSNWYDSWIPRKVETDSLTINDSHLRLITADGDATIKGTRWDIEPTDTLAKGKLRASGGTVALPYAWAPTAELDRLRMTYQDGQVYLTDAKMRVYENGHIDLGGEVDVANKSYSVEGTVRDVMCNEVLPPDWRQRLMGKIESGFVVRSGNPNPTVNGQLVIHQGVLTALPVLDKLAAYSQSVRFRTLTLHTAECDYEWSGDRIVLTNVKLGSEGLARMEGHITFTRKGDGEPYAIHGNFQVGLAPGTLAQIPGAEEDVFQPGPRGLLWAPMNLSGTTEAPKEDLSDRLMAAAGARMFDIIPATGQRVLKYTQQVIEDTPVVGGVMNQATELGGNAIKQGTHVVEQAVQGTTGVVNSVFDIFGRPVVPAQTPNSQSPVVPKKNDATDGLEKNTENP
jgi:hypothetical protein